MYSDKINAFNYQSFHKNAVKGKISIKPQTQQKKLVIDKTEINLQSSSLSKAYMTTSTTKKETNIKDKKTQFNEISIDGDLDKKVSSQIYKSNSHLEKQLVSSYTKSYQKRDQSTRAKEILNKIDVKSRNNKTNIARGGEIYNTDNFQNGKSLSFDKNANNQIFHTIKKDISKNSQTNTIKRKQNDKLVTQPKIYVTQNKLGISQKPQQTKQLFLQRNDNNITSSIFSHKVSLSTKSASKLITTSKSKFDVNKKSYLK